MVLSVSNWRVFEGQFSVINLSLCEASFINLGLTLRPKLTENDRN